MRVHRGKRPARHDFIKRYRQDYDIVAVYHSQAPEGISQERWIVDPLDPGADIPENHDAVFAVSADLVSDTEIKRVAELALARFGRVNLLVNGAVAFARQPIVGSGRLRRGLRSPIPAERSCAAYAVRGHGRYVLALARPRERQAEPAYRQRGEHRWRAVLPGERAQHLQRVQGGPGAAEPPHGQ